MAACPRRLSSGIGVRGRTDIPKDNRPLDDKRYQNKCIGQLLQFLHEHQYPYPVSNKLLASPSWKDFYQIFEFICSKLNDGYIISSKQEVPSVLRQLGYPYTISKSFMLSVGTPHTWPQLLAALIWMIDLLKMKENIPANGDLDSYIFGVTGEDFDRNLEVKLAFDYCKKTYLAYMSGADSYESFDEELKQMLVAMYFGGNYQENIHENITIEQELTILEQAEERCSKIKDHIGMLNHDINVLQAYIEDMRRYRKAQEIEVQTKSEECYMLKLDLQAEMDRLIRLSQMLEIHKSQDLSLSDIERLKAEREGLKQQVEQLEKQIANIDLNIWNLSIEQAKLNEKVDEEAITYNILAIECKLVPETAEHAQGQDFRLRPGVSSDPVSDFEKKVQPKLTSMRKCCQESIGKTKKSIFQLANENEQFQEVLSARRDKIVKLQKELISVESNIEQMKQMSNSDKKSQVSEIDALELDVVQLESSCKQLVSEKIQLSEECSSRSKSLNRLIEKTDKEISKIICERGKNKKECFLKVEMNGFVEYLKTKRAEVAERVNKLRTEAH
ncbi:kinetochore protein NDC80 homolog [Physella acuta]|uniref:kinetochore protein NDC80 homolog n=1 Tax=Physella acuta TaxID=109671 RepID=UPI0027DAF019|nr:kinetochore protein NDC80 homolog [Physella acuta]